MFKGRGRYDFKQYPNTPKPANTAALSLKDVGFRVVIYPQPSVRGPLV